MGQRTLPKYVILSFARVGASNDASRSPNKTRFSRRGTTERRRAASQKNIRCFCSLFNKSASRTVTEKNKKNKNAHVANYSDARVFFFFFRVYPRCVFEAARASEHRTDVLAPCAYGALIRANMTTKITAAPRRRYFSRARGATVSWKVKKKNSTRDFSDFQRPRVTFCR